MKKNHQRLITWVNTFILVGCAWTNPDDLYAQSNSPIIGLDANSNRIVVWETCQPIENIYQVRGAIMSNSGWTVFSDTISPSTPSQNPVLYVHYDSGNAVVTWGGIDPSSGNPAVQVALYNAAKGVWLPPLTVSSSSESAAADYQATIDGLGVACVTWSSYTKTDQYIYGATVDFDKTISRTRLYP